MHLPHALRGSRFMAAALLATAPARLLALQPRPTRTLVFSLVEFFGMLAYLWAILRLVPPERPGGGGASG